MLLSGPGGVGKSHVIYSDTLRFLRLSGAIEPDDVIVLLTAPIGVAAFNINGMTLHSVFLLGGGKYTGFQPLSYRIAGKFGGELNLAVWWSSLRPPN